MSDIIQNEEKVYHANGLENIPGGYHKASQCGEEAHISDDVFRMLGKKKDTDG